MAELAIDAVLAMVVGLVSSVTLLVYVPNTVDTMTSVPPDPSGLRKSTSPYIQAGPESDRADRGCHAVVQSQSALGDGFGRRDDPGLVDRLAINETGRSHINVGAARAIGAKMKIGAAETALKVRSVACWMAALVNVTLLLPNVSLTATKPVRSIVSPGMNPVMAIEPRPEARLLPDTVQCALSNCKVAKLVMLVPLKPDSVPALAPDASSTTSVLPARLWILPLNTAPGSTISRLGPPVELKITAPRLPLVLVIVPALTMVPASCSQTPPFPVIVPVDRPVTDPPRPS